MLTSDWSPPSLSSPDEYHLWVIRQFELRAEEAAAAAREAARVLSESLRRDSLSDEGAGREARREAARVAPEGEREAPRP